jgi:hypothetical protein
MTKNDHFDLAGRSKTLIFSKITKKCPSDRAKVLSILTKGQKMSKNTLFCKKRSFKSRDFSFFTFSSEKNP